MDFQVGSDRRINSGIDCFAFIIDRQGIQRLADSCFTGIEFFADAIFFDRYRQSAFQLNNFPGLLFSFCPVKVISRLKSPTLAMKPKGESSRMVLSL